MPKVEMKQRKGNVYFTPTKQPPIDTRRQWSEVKTPFMPQHSQENVDLWWGIFTEIGNECHDRPPRRRVR